VIDPPDDTWKASDDALQIFLATIKPGDLNDWEYAAYQYHYVRRTT